MECRRVTWLSPIPQPLCPAPACASCPQIPTCNKARPLTLGADFNVLAVAPLCQPGPCLVPAPVASPLQRVNATSGPKGLCIAAPKRYYDDSLDNVNTLREYRYRWKNETCSGPDPLTGYKTLPFARPIPRYDGFKPRFPHPLPKANPSPTTIELTSTMREQFRCPATCDGACKTYNRGRQAMCVSQLHPYTPFSGAVKVTNTW